MVRHSSGLNSASDAGPLELARHAFAFPLRRFGQERADENQRNRRDDAGDERVTPGFVTAVNRRQIERDLGGEHVHRADEQAAERRERLRVAEHFFALIAVGEQFRQPRHGGDEFHAHADEHEAAEHQQLRQRRGIARREGRERIKQNAERQHAPATEPVGEITAEQTEHAARDGRDEEQRARPLHVLSARSQSAAASAAGMPPSPALDQRRAQRGDGRLDDERQHQQLVDVERKADGGDDADEPLRAGEAK